MLGCVTRGRLGGRAGGLEGSAEIGDVETFVEQQFGCAAVMMSTIRQTRVVLYRPEGVEKRACPARFSSNSNSNSGELGGGREDSVCRSSRARGSGGGGRGHGALTKVRGEAASVSSDCGGGMDGEVKWQGEESTSPDGRARARREGERSSAGQRYRSAAEQLPSQLGNSIHARRPTRLAARLSPPRPACRKRTACRSFQSLRSCTARRFDGQLMDRRARRTPSACSSARSRRLNDGRIDEASQFPPLGLYRGHDLMTLLARGQRWLVPSGFMDVSS